MTKQTNDPRLPIWNTMEARAVPRGRALSCILLQLLAAYESVFSVKIKPMPEATVPALARPGQSCPDCLDPIVFQNSIATASGSPSNSTTSVLTDSEPHERTIRHYVHLEPKMHRLLLATAFLPSALGCILFNATLHNGPKTANSADEAIDIANKQESGSGARDPRLDLSLWDDTNNDNVVDVLKDSFCHGVDLKPYEDNTWVVKCTPEERGVELDVHWDPDITAGGVLVNVLKYNNPRAQSEKFNDPGKDLVYSFQVGSKDEKEEFFEARIFCNDCKGPSGQAVKC
ncbi:hypothetical protein AC579_10056 [Pseudocercospora musae]|uniref:Uncharacterized protein n=1 Tax=Pseudocercospora musae TaxID=113226 RepID=A0A139I671_9PEZI|nr:hypothetical protein AC579_10056 [Pseudocercospora musae]